MIVDWKPLLQVEAGLAVAPPADFDFELDDYTKTERKSTSSTDYLLHSLPRLLDNIPESTLANENFELTVTPDEIREAYENYIPSYTEDLPLPANLSDVESMDNQTIATFKSTASSTLSDLDYQFWASFCSNYTLTATKVPNYTATMVRAGIPPPIRGYAWKAMLHVSADCTLEKLYSSLAIEWSPYVKIISRDLHRTFPQIEMFKEEGGEGQLMLGKVLRAYSVYDMQVGYCQGLSFIVAPLLLHMTDCDAFCVLVKLMEVNSLRQVFGSDMAGLRIWLYQFEKLFEQQLPLLYEHFEKLGVQSIYTSQWFLSLFAVSAPLPILLRMWDLMFMEGVSETLMRTALAVLKKNQPLLLSLDESEDIMQHLLSRAVWGMYGDDVNDFLIDVVSFDIEVASASRLSELENELKQSELPPEPRQPPSRLSFPTAFLQSYENVKSAFKKSPTPSMHERRFSMLSLSSTNTSNRSHTADSYESLTTTLSNISLQPSDAKKINRRPIPAKQTEIKSQKEVDDLQTQISALLTTVQSLQKKQEILTDELDDMKIKREVDKSLVLQLLNSLGKEDTDTINDIAEIVRSRYD